MLAVADGPLVCGPVAWHRSKLCTSSSIECSFQFYFYYSRRASRSRHSTPGSSPSRAVAPGLCAVACVQWPI